MSPDSYYAAAAEEPRVVFWYRIYCGVMAALYLLCSGAGVALVLFREPLAEGDPETTALGLASSGVILIGMGVVLMAAFVASFFLPRQRWAWIYHIVLICLGLTSCCTIPASLPLLIFWIKPETQDWYRS